MQLSESLTMGLSLIVDLRAQPQRAALGRRHTLSHANCRCAAQRFAWEFPNTPPDPGLAI
jgi:hypothetical protein